MSKKNNKKKVKLSEQKKPKEKATHEVRFFKLSKNVKNPKINEIEDQKFINYGIDNKLPEQLLELYSSVGVHRAILQKKINMFTGSIGIEGEPTDKQYIKTRKFLDNINKYESIEQLIVKVGLDYFLFGGFYLQILWSRDKKKIAEMYHMMFDKMRSGVGNEFNIVENYYFNASHLADEQWSLTTEEKDDYIKEFPAFNLKEKSKPQILFSKKYDPSNIFYPFPDYIGAIKDLDTLGAIADFHNSNIHNNMQPGYMITYTGPEPSEEDKDVITKQIQDKYSDTENTGKPMLFFLDTDIKMEITPIDTSDIADMYEKLSADVKENVVISHQILKAVISLSQAGSLGNTKEIIEGNEMFMESYIMPAQEFVLEVFNKLLRINGLNEIFIVNKPVSLLRYSLDELGKYLDRNEIREYLGREAIEPSEEEKEATDE